MVRPGPAKTTVMGVAAIALITVGWAGRPAGESRALGIVPMSFLTAVASGDAEELAAPEALVTEGSPAAAYAGLAARTVQTLRTAGVAMPTTVSVQPVADGYRVCADDDACSDFSRIRLAADGRVRSFVVDGVPVERIVGDGDQGDHGDDQGDDQGDDHGEHDGEDGPHDPDPTTTSTTDPAPTTVPTTEVPVPVDPTTTTSTTAPAPAPTTVPTTEPPATTVPTTSTSVPAPTTTTTITTTVAPPTPTTAAPSPTTTPPPATTPPTTAPSPSPSPAAGRDLRRWPFSVTSPWNVGIASAAMLAPPSDARTATIRAAQAPTSNKAGSLPVVTWINSTSYSVPVYEASAGDPLVTLDDTVHGERTQVRVPSGAIPAAGTDANMALVQPDGTTVDVWSAHWVGPTTLSVGRFERTSLAGTGLGPQAGIRASGLSSIGGLIRRWEVDPTDPAYTDGVIRHALALSLPSGMLRYDGGSPGYDATGYGTARGYVWPATEQDYDSPWTYGGSIPMGTLVAIPRSVDLGGLGLGPETLALARALQDYGGYVVDRAGDGTAAFYAEPTVPSRWYAGVTGPTWTGQQLTTIRHLLQVVADNGPGSIGGGGARVVAAAPDPS